MHQGASPLRGDKFSKKEKRTCDKVDMECVGEEKEKDASQRDSRGEETSNLCGGRNHIYWGRRPSQGKFSEGVGVSLGRMAELLGMWNYEVSSLNLVSNWL